jgi:hypothetical protein
VALDERYRDKWTVQEDADVKDAVGRSKVVPVGIEDGRVIMDTRGWVSMPPETAIMLGYYLQSAGATLQVQQRRNRPGGGA